MKIMATIMATTFGIFDIVVPGSNREALASHNQSLSIKSSHSEALASGVFDDNRWRECAPGIHFFMDRQDAVEYEF